ncbi:hypothetical protein H257_14660 [Aphanomyces astaci]|uniref:Uncharacterized protein n=1 Tax=Aphanomyces astaci TaxID=112090 RepID=W4FQ84_APHAT|nr:hypothetical protein H257_14660 [Aphanomyces astaci]ETV69637.1 hypothetical protein H257_14660 [Aphanomyces astaci]|eukprot:XP_009840853.1 hypothetical protein H257_14660 [Aphanomyces astaci]
MQTPFLPTSHSIPVYMAGTSIQLWSRLWLRRWERTPRFVRSRTGPHLPLRVAVAMEVKGTILAGLEKAHMVRVDSVGAAADPEGMVVMAVEVRLPPADRHSLVGNARKQSLKLESVDKLQVNHFLGHLDDLQIEFELTDIELIRIFEYRVTESKIQEHEREDGRNYAEQYPQGERPVREYAWRIKDATQDLELRYSQAVQIFIDGCKDPGVASCIHGLETQPGTIQECLDYLRFRDVDLHMRLNDANGHDVPRSTILRTRWMRPASPQKRLWLRFGRM